MQWESWSAFWSMGGAAFYVWGSYGLMLALIIVELVSVSRRRKHTVLRLLRWRRAIGKDAGKPAGKSAVATSVPVLESEQ